MHDFAMLRAALATTLMLVAAFAAVALRPSIHVAEQQEKIDLEQLIPRNFGEWKEESSGQILVLDPQQLAMLHQIYSQTMARTYRNAAGYRVMVSIAYGSDQRDAMQVHKPEVCYPAQGFVVSSMARREIQLDGLSIPVVQLVAAMGSRIEPVTYWTTIGNQVVKDGLDKKIKEIGYGITGRIPDGMLIRISSIDKNEVRAYGMHMELMDGLLKSLGESARRRIFGGADV